MFSSVEGKAEYKKAILPYVLGCFMLVGISVLIGVIGNIAKEDTPLEKATKLTTDIIEGTRKVQDLSNEELKSAYSNNGIARNLGEYMGKRGGELTLDQAVDKLSDYQKEIYNEAKARGLLNGTGLK